MMHCALSKPVASIAVPLNRAVPLGWQGDDLTTTISVSRAQADKGIKVTIPLLDGTDHIVHTGARQIFHGYCSVARGKGMPIKGGPKRGDLKIEFRVAKP